MGEGRTGVDWRLNEGPDNEIDWIKPFPLPRFTTPIVAVIDAPATVDGNAMVLPVITVTTFPSVGSVYVTRRLGAVPTKVKPMVPVVDGEGDAALVSA